MLSVMDSLMALGPYQWAGLIFGILYVYLAGRNNPLCWIFGIISCTSIAIEDFTKTMLLADGYLQVFYVIMAFWGLYQWRTKHNTKALEISALSHVQHFVIICTGIGLTMVIYYIFQSITGVAHALLDSLTTAFSIIATFLLVFKKIENWVYWIWIDLVYVYLYFDQTAPLFSILMVVYTILAFWALIQWHKIFRKS